MLLFSISKSISYQGSKGIFFPYNHIKDYNQLIEEKQLPPYEAFYWQLNNRNLLAGPDNDDVVGRENYQMLQNLRQLDVPQQFNLVYFDIETTYLRK